MQHGGKVNEAILGSDNNLRERMFQLVADWYRFQETTQNKKFDENVETAIKLWPKSLRSVGLSHSHANGMQHNITKNSAGSSRRARLS